MGQTQDNSSNKYFNRYVALLAMVRDPDENVVEFVQRVWSDTQALKAI